MILPISFKIKVYDWLLKYAEKKRTYWYNKVEQIGTRRLKLFDVDMPDPNNPFE